MKFYVSPDGSDAANGNTEATPWATLDFLNTKLADGSVAPGDVVLLQRGREHFGTLTPLLNYPVAGEYLTFGGYDNGQRRRPKVTQYKILNTAGGWALHAAGVWKIDLTSPATHTGYNSVANTNIGHLLLNGVSLYANRVWVIGDLAAQWDFFCDATFLYVKSSANPTTLAADIRAAPDVRGGILAPSTKYVGLEVTGSGQHGFSYSGGPKHSRVYDCEIHSMGGSVNGVQTAIDDITGAVVPQRYGNGVEVWIGSIDVAVERNYIYDIFDAALTAQGTLAGAQIQWDRVAFRSNRIARCEQSVEYWSAGVTQAGAGFLACVCEDNVCSDAGHSFSTAVRPNRRGGVHLQTFGWSLPADILVQRNVFYNARTAHRRGVPGNPTPGLVSKNNLIALYSGTQIRRDQAGNPADLPTDYGTIENSAAYVATNNDDRGSKFIILSSTPPAEISSALQQLGASSGMALARGRADGMGIDAARGDSELTREIARNPAKLAVGTTTASSAPAITIRRPGEAFPRMELTDGGGIKIGGGVAAADNTFSRNGPQQLFYDGELKSQRAAVGAHFTGGVTGDAVAARWTLSTQGAAGVSGASKLTLGGGSVAADVVIYWDQLAVLGIDGDLAVKQAGKGLRVKEGANAKQGITGAMVAGTLLVANTAITANSRLQLTRQAGGANPGAVFESARVAGTSFTVTSTNAADTGTVAFEIFEPG